jgi:hypothetical protein
MNKSILASVIGGLLITSMSGYVFAGCKMSVLKGNWTVQINVPTSVDRTVRPIPIVEPGTNLVCSFVMQKDGTSEPYSTFCIQTPVDQYSWGNLVSAKATQKFSDQTCNFDIELIFDDNGGGRATNLNGNMTTDKKGLTGWVRQGSTPIGGFTASKTIQ